MKVLVTGGNQGIGFALCRQLAIEDNCDVLLTARSQQKGMDAVATIQNDITTNHPDCTGSIDFLILDTSDDKSVAEAAAAFKENNKNKNNGGDLLDAIVNNAGIGFNTGQDENVLNTNLYGPKRVCDSFMPYLNKENGRIVNVGSGSGPMYVSSASCSKEEKIMLCSGGDPESEISWADIESHAKKNLVYSNGQNNVYGLSKCLVACYTGLLAREFPSLVVSCVSPGFIQTQMTNGYGASKSPEEGTVSIRMCLFDTLTSSGWYYGSDGVRSPYHFMRNPGEPEYDGINPFL